LGKIPLNERTYRYSGTPPVLFYLDTVSIPLKKSGFPFSFTCQFIKKEMFHKVFYPQFFHRPGPLINTRKPIRTADRFDLEAVIRSCIVPPPLRVKHISKHVSTEAYILWLLFMKNSILHRNGRCKYPDSFLPENRSAVRFFLCVCMCPTQILTKFVLCWIILGTF
jgi:hypothetical protein